MSMQVGLLVGLKWWHLVKWPGLLDPTLKLEVHDQLVLAAEQLHKKLHKDVKDVRFVAITDSIHCKSQLGVHDREPSRD